MKHLFKTAALLCLMIAPTAGHSIELETLDLTLSTNRINGNSLDNSTVYLDNKQVTVDASGTLVGRLGFELGAGAADPSDSLRGANNVRRLSTALTFDVSDKIEIGAYGDWARFDWLGRYETNSYGLQARYSDAAWQISGYLGQSDYGELGVADKADNFGLDAQYGISDRLMLGAYYDYENLSLAKLQRYGLNLGWRVSNSGQVPVILRASIGKHQIDSSKSNSFAITLHVPLKGDGRFDRSGFTPHSGFQDGYAITGLHSGPSAPHFCTLYPDRCR